MWVQLVLVVVVVKGPIWMVILLFIDVYFLQHSSSVRLSCLKYLISIYVI